MNPTDRSDTDRRAKDLRQQEIARLLGEFRCTVRKALARAGQRPTPACPTRPGLAT